MRPSNLKNNFKRIYFFSSGWIAKAGVLPWFLSLALRRLPIFFFFEALLFFVIRVFDTILNLLAALTKIQLQNALLPLLIPLVKARAWRYALFSMITPLYADAKPIVLSPGQHKELFLEEGSRFTVSNGNILHYQEVKEQEQLLLRAISPGESQIVVWPPNKDAPRIHSIYISAASPLSVPLKWQQVLEKSGVSAHPLGPVIILKGTLSELSSYQTIHQLLAGPASPFSGQELRLSLDLREKIIGEVYGRFFSNFKDQISCNLQGIQFFCEYEKGQEISESEMKWLKEAYHIHFITREHSKTRPKNYRVKLKVIQEERLDGSEIGIGLDQIQVNVSDLFQNGLQALIENNQILLRNKKLSLSTLASPEIFLRPNEKGLISIGTDIPFQVQNNYGQITTEWRFAGLKIDLLLRPQGQRIILDYELEFSGPQNGGQVQTISGSREKASVLIFPGQGKKLFQIMFQTQGNSSQSLPVLGQIPLIRHLFRSQSTQQTYKRLTGFLVVTAEEVHRK